MNLYITGFTFFLSHSLCMLSNDPHNYKNTRTALTSSGRQAPLEESCSFEEARRDPKFYEYADYIFKKLETLASDSEFYEKYVLGDFIAKGGFGGVYEATELSTGAKVAVKSIDLRDFEEDVYRIANEVEILAKLNPKGQPGHPNVVKYYHAFLRGRAEFTIVMELLQDNLYDTWNNSSARALPEYVLAAIAKQILLGLQYIHEKGIIHRDLKHENIMLDMLGNLKIVDFGLSLMRKAGGYSLTYLGTRGFMSPEVRRQEPYDDRTDSYGVGVIIFEMATNSNFLVPYGTPLNEFLIDKMQKHSWSDEFCYFLLCCLQPNQQHRARTEELLDTDFILNADDSVNVGQYFRSMTKAPSSNTTASLAYAGLQSKFSADYSFSESTLSEESLASALINLPEDMQSELKSLVNADEINDNYIILNLRGNRLEKYGEIYDAVQRKPFVAASVMVIDFLNYDYAIQKTILNEIKTLAALDHPNIVEVKECYVSTESGKLFVVLTPMYGSLASIWGKTSNRPVHEDVLAVIAKHLLFALKYLHENEIIHRDLKQESVILDLEGNLRLTDFALAVVHGQSAAPVDDIVGTDGFMSPEILKKLPYDGRADIYALGFLIFQMATGMDELKIPRFHSLRRYLKKLAKKFSWSIGFTEFLLDCLRAKQKKRKTAVELLAIRFIRDADNWTNLYEYFKNYFVEEK